MFGLSLHPAEVPLTSANARLIDQLGAQALRFHLPVNDMAQASAIVDSFKDYPGTLLAILDLKPEDADIAARVCPLVERFNSRIQHWEISSEPDDPRWGWPSDDLVAYAACLKTAGKSIHAIDPNAKVHNGGLGRTLPKGIARLYELGAGSVVDVWNVHPYMNPMMPDTFGGLNYFHDMIRKTINANGDSAKPIWWTSIGCPGMTNPKATKDWWLGKNPTEIIQAEWVKTVLTKPASWGVQAVYWQDLMDHPDVYGNGCDFFGLYRCDGSPKLAAGTYRDKTLTTAP